MHLKSDGRERVFKVAIRWVALVSLHQLEQALSGHSFDMPFETIQALDVVMRHLPSLMLVLTMYCNNESQSTHSTFICISFYYH